jgi:putative ABC transport system permease protein
LKTGESFATAMHAILANKFRALLTMLGIIIGVAAVITMIGIGEGAQRAVVERIQSLGSNLLFVSPGVRRGGGGIVTQGGSSVRLRIKDADAIRSQSPYVDAVVPELSRQAQVKHENRNWGTRIIGTVPEYESVRSFRAARGRFFTHSEERGVAKVCLLGATVAENLFPAGDPLGGQIRIAGQTFAVIGLLESKGQSGWQNPDDQIIVPLSTAQRRLFGLDYLSQITVRAPSDGMMEHAFLDIERILRREHRLRPEWDNDFTIRNQADIIQTFQETQETFTLLLAGIAAVSLIVGGIGIMNIMLISVTERTREIGIRKAVGARKRDILLQFLIESVVLSVVGGILGIGTGIAASFVITKYGEWNPVISADSIALSFAFASLVGIFFGLYPAWKAAMADTIDALRYE